MQLVRNGLAVPYWNMHKKLHSHQIPEPTDEDLNRIGKILRRVGGSNVTWGAASILEILTLEHRAKLDQQMNERIRSSSWALFIATVGLLICTAGLIWATLVS